MKNRLYPFLFKQRNASTLGLFRIFFGLVLLYQAIYYIKIGFVHNFVTGPEYLFQYPIYEYLPILPEGLLNALLYIMLLSAVGITLGFFYKISMLTYGVIFTYLSFMDITLYNNHIYLFFPFMFCASVHAGRIAGLAFQAAQLAGLPPPLIGICSFCSSLLSWFIFMVDWPN